MSSSLNCLNCVATFGSPWWEREKLLQNRSGTDEKYKLVNFFATRLESHSERWWKAFDLCKWCYKLFCILRKNLLHCSFSEDFCGSLERTDPCAIAEFTSISQVTSWSYHLLKVVIYENANLSWLSWSLAGITRPNTSYCRHSSCDVDKKHVVLRSEVEEDE